MNEKDHGKQSDIIAMESTPKSKNKPSKQKRDAAKRRQIRLQEKDKEHEQDGTEESGNKFIMVEDNHGLDILSLQAQYMTPPKTDPPNLRQQKGTLNNVPI